MQIIEKKHEIGKRKLSKLATNRIGKQPEKDEAGRVKKPVNLNYGERP